MPHFRAAVPFIAGMLLCGCGAREPGLHGAPEVALPCVIAERDLDFHTLLSTCLYARQRYEVLFGRSAHPVSIIVWDTTAMSGEVRNGRVVFKQPGMGAMSRARSSFSRDAIEVSGEPTLLLAHELGHMLLIADTRREPGGYGSTLPDWFDEAVAIWAETEVARSDRIRQAAALDDAALDLLAFVTQRHPYFAGSGFQHRIVRTSTFRCRRQPCGDLSPVGRDTFRIVSTIDLNGVARVDTVFPEDPEFHLPDTNTYYAVASTVLPFLHDRGGSALVNELVDRMRSGRTGSDLFTQLPGMSPDPVDLSREWRAFVKAAATEPARSP